jgi:hypothetical protein
MSEPALVLGAAVVKAAVKLWAGGNPFGDELRFKIEVEGVPFFVS